MAEHDGLEINSSRVALVGGSAGGNLAAAEVLLAHRCPLPNRATIVALGILYPALDLAMPYEDKVSRVKRLQALPGWMSRLFLACYLPPPRDRRDPLVSPALASNEELSRFPPTVVLTGSDDYLACEADDFARKLESLGIDVRHRRFPDVGHAFDSGFALTKTQRSLNEDARSSAWGMLVGAFKAAI